MRLKWPICIKWSVLGALTFSQSGWGAELPKGFVYLRDVEPSIAQDIRYAGSNNFTERKVPGYEAAECILREAAAHALKAANRELMRRGFSLKTYDCYRPQRAVRAFLRWAAADSASPSGRFHPRVGKGALVSLGYIGARSPHSSGVAVDVTIVRLPVTQEAVLDPTASYADCSTDPSMRAPDNGIDMGSGFDCFDAVSHRAAHGLTLEQAKNRELLVEVMARHGFSSYSREWWHFTHGLSIGEHGQDFPITPRSHREN